MSEDGWCRFCREGIETGQTICVDCEERGYTTKVSDFVNSVEEKWEDYDDKTHLIHNQLDYWLRDLGIHKRNDYTLLCLPCQINQLYKKHFTIKLLELKKKLCECESLEDYALEHSIDAEICDFCEAEKKYIGVLK